LINVGWFVPLPDDIATAVGDVGAADSVDRWPEFEQPAIATTDASARLRKRAGRFHPNPLRGLAMFICNLRAENESRSE